MFGVYSLTIVLATEAAGIEFIDENGGGPGHDFGSSQSRSDESSATFCETNPIVSAAIETALKATSKFRRGRIRRGEFGGREVRLARDAKK